MSSETIVSRIDHLSVCVRDPDEVFARLTGMLGLPAIWAPARFAGFVSGGVALGNVFVETIRYAQGSRPAPAGAVCVALEPAGIARAAVELDRRGVPHSAPFPYMGSPSRTPSSPRSPWRSGRGPLWTTMMLGGLMGDEVLARRFAREARTPRASRAASLATANVATRIRPLGDAVMAAVLPPTAWAFLCEWHRLDVAGARAESRDLLTRAQGGALGVTGVREVVVAPDGDAERRRWDALLAPCTAGEDGCWRFAAGPALRVVTSAHHPAQHIVLDTRSLEAAARALDACGLLARNDDEELRVDPERLGGLDLRLREAPVREPAAS